MKLTDKRNIIELHNKKKPEPDPTLKRLENMDAISKIPLGPKEPVLETVTKLSKIQGLQEESHLTDIQTLFLNHLYKENIQIMKGNNDPEFRSEVKFLII